ncbi:MAG: TIGR00725 family protein [Pseudomonadota bacterium]
MNRPHYVGIIGAGDCSGPIHQLARDVGFEIGKRGWFLVCGGLGGVMEGAAKGCIEAGGMTIGLLPGLGKDDANPFIRIPIATGLAEGRNLIVVRASDVLIAISGGYGTLSEIALALKINKPVIGLETWKDIKGILYVAHPAEAVAAAAEILSR